MNEGRFHPATPQHRPTGALPRSLVLLTSLTAVVAVISVLLLGGCQVSVSTTSSTAPQTSATNTTSLSPSSSSQDTTTTTSSLKTVNTGTGLEFTMDWPSPNGTSLPYLIFYNNVKYSPRHMWVRLESPNTVRIGISDYCQRMFGSLWSVNLDAPGTVVTKGMTFGFIQGEDTMDYNLTAPVSGTILAINEDALSDYYLINSSPYDAGWLFLVQLSDPSELAQLLSPAEYATQYCPPCHCNN